MDTDWTGYDKGVARELKKNSGIISEGIGGGDRSDDSKLTPYSASICGRTQRVNESKEELDEFYRIFPDTKRINQSASEPRLSLLEMMAFAVLQTVFA